MRALSRLARAPGRVTRRYGSRRVVRTKASLLDRAERALRRASGDYERSELAYLAYDPASERTAHASTSAINGSVRVAAFGPWRSLRFNEIEQGLAYCGREAAAAAERDGKAAMDDEALPYEYLRVMTAASMGLLKHKGLDPSTGGRARVFHVGLGAGAAPAFWQRTFPESDVEVVEIDPVVLNVARDVLGVKMRVHGENFGDKGSMRVILGDCARVLEERSALDVIFMDAFDGEGEIPRHLRDETFLETCGNALGEDGSLVVNMFNGTRGSPARETVRDFARLLERYIGPVCSFPVMDSPVNVVLSATKSKSTRPTRDEFILWTKSMGERAGFAWQPERLVEGAFWVDATGDEILEAVAGGKPGIRGRFRGRNGTLMPREFLDVVEHRE
ncbi:Spermidine/spermine synthases family [Ostreococcus tauri]|uniref:S-adenosyl-L-methionine-dependent methyltransferase n=1 Tax=Ostreococcus tauri TaxID=70448 RepID=A0A096P7N8_OSTTA|nr:Spermidine/spermine synthases family [Ostreococcus tauri]OUS43694.1 S-adenosyl-L-methionine-dependent methyltransferase [Ostreococcus tauri]CEF97029.1 Spermidine/spermine synthases family [Ostreococcus tauri]|eukprot:XP_022838443.1 Spermidine/spermine synthases family [Ostreococcus tauri]